MKPRTTPDFSRCVFLNSQWTPKLHSMGTCISFHREIWW